MTTAIKYVCRSRRTHSSWGVVESAFLTTALSDTSHSNMKGEELESLMGSRFGTYLHNEPETYSLMLCIKAH